MSQISITLLSLATVLPYVLGHSGPAPLNWQRDNVNARDALQNKCSGTLDEARRKRSLAAEQSANLKRRELNLPERRSFSIGEGKGSRRANNDSTVLFTPEKVTPETTQGPYHVLDEIVRQNITETQPGIPLELNFEFFDVATCGPIQVWVDGWSANATGFYAGYTSITGGSGGGFPGPPSGGAPEGMPTGGFPQPSVPAGGWGPYDGADDPNDPETPKRLNTATTDSLTWLKGVWQTDQQGKMKVFTIVPGWYTGRAVHYHVKVYPKGHAAGNGTFVPDGSAVHTGQVFFENEFMEKVAQTHAYQNNSISWQEAVKPDKDQWYPYQSATGYNAFADIVYVNEKDISAGVVGHIAIALNLTHSSPEISTQIANFDVEAYHSSGLLPSYTGPDPTTSASGAGSSSAPNSSSPRTHRLPVSYIALVVSMAVGIVALC